MSHRKLNELRHKACNKYGIDNVSFQSVTRFEDIKFNEKKVQIIIVYEGVIRKSSEKDKSLDKSSVMVEQTGSESKEDQSLETNSFHQTEHRPTTNESKSTEEELK